GVLDAHCYRQALVVTIDIPFLHPVSVLLLVGEGHVRRQGEAQLQVGCPLLALAVEKQGTLLAGLKLPPDRNTLAGLSQYRRQGEASELSRRTPETMSGIRAGYQTA